MLFSPDICEWRNGAGRPILPQTKNKNKKKNYFFSPDTKGDIALKILPTLLPPPIYETGQKILHATIYISRFSSLM